MTALLIAGLAMTAATVIVYALAILEAHGYRVRLVKDGADVGSSANKEEKCRHEQHGCDRSKSFHAVIYAAENCDPSEHGRQRREQERGLREEAAARSPEHAPLDSKGDEKHRDCLCDERALSRAEFHDSASSQTGVLA